MCLVTGDLEPLCAASLLALRELNLAGNLIESLDDFEAQKRRLRARLTPLRILLVYVPAVVFGVAAAVPRRVVAQALPRRRRCPVCPIGSAGGE